MKSEFEKWLGDVWLSDAEWDESKNTYSDSRIHCMWSAWQHQQSKVDELKSTIEKQKKLSLKAIENAKAGSSLELQLAQKLHAESSPDSLESERAMNAQLTNENLLLESKVDELQKRVDGLTQVVEELLEEMKYPTATFEEVICSGVRELEQALKGESNESST